MGFWTDARTHGQILKNAFSEIPFRAFKSEFPNAFSKKNGVGKNSRALCLVRTESIPAAYLLAPVGVAQQGKYELLRIPQKTKTL